MSNIGVAPASHPMYNFSDPKRVGPGVWTMFMLMSATADDELERLLVCKCIRSFCNFFKCMKCKPHALRYISNDPPERAIITNERLFGWVVRFMNAVNVRIGKPLYDARILWRQFTEPDFMPCTSDCGSNEVVTERDTRVVPVRKDGRFYVTRFSM